MTDRQTLQELTTKIDRVMDFISTGPQPPHYGAFPIAIHELAQANINAKNHLEEGTGYIYFRESTETTNGTTIHKHFEIPNNLFTGLLLLGFIIWVLYMLFWK